MTAKKLETILQFLAKVITKVIFTNNNEWTYESMNESMRTWPEFQKTPMVSSGTRPPNVSLQFITLMDCMRNCLFHYLKGETNFGLHKPCFSI